MQRLKTSDAGFAQAFRRLVADRRESDERVARDVEVILSDVRGRGDAALADMTRKWDGHTLASDADWTISAEACREAFDDLKPDLRAALELAAKRIRLYHEGQKPADRDEIDKQGVRLGARWLPVDAAGLYVPGGRAAYPSSLLMNAIPAKVAGVERLVVVTPTPKGVINPLVLAAAHLAYGTERIKPVDVVTGPGNAWVAEAKRQLYGVVGIDMVAGPSEILLIADGQNDVEWTCADLLSQAEHDPAAQSILITDDPLFADMVADRMGIELAMLPTARVAAESWKNHGVIIEVAHLDEAPALANALAAEHVQIATDDPEALFRQIRHAGSVFLGRYSPEAVGDYVAGPNHVLPTGRRARFSSGLSVLDFMKRTSFIQLDEKALGKIGPAAIALAEAEGLPAHARSIEVRLGI
jgi:histidinol dehydrogenase